MRLAQCAAFALLVGLPFTQSTLAQEAQQIDRTDPVAVAQAYLQACSDGDVEAVLSLLAGDNTFRERARLLMRSYVDWPEEDRFSFADMFREALLVPTKMELDRELAGSTLHDDTAEVAFRAGYAFDQNLVLNRQPDGTWAVDLLESVKATTGSSDTFLTQAIMSLDLEGPEGVRRYDCEYRLNQLWTAMQQYVADHEGKLPPADRWVDEVELYVLDRSLFRNPQQPDLEYAFAMNVEAGGRDIQDLELWDEDDEPEDFVVFFEWPTGERNARASLEELGRLSSQPETSGTAYITAFGRTDTLPAGMTWAEKQERDREEMAKMEDERLTASATQRCEAHLRALGQAARKYARDHGGLLPGAETWQDDLALYLLEADNEVWPDVPGVQPAEDDVLRCPGAPDLDYAYAINAEIAGKNALDLTDHDEIILFFECDLNIPNAAGVPERDAPEGGRHGAAADPTGQIRMYNQVLYLSGRTGWLERPHEGPWLEE